MKLLEESESSKDLVIVDHRGFKPRMNIVEENEDNDGNIKFSKSYDNPSKLQSTGGVFGSILETVTSLILYPFKD